MSVFLSGVQLGCLGVLVVGASIMVVGAVAHVRLGWWFMLVPIVLIVSAISAVVFGVKEIRDREALRRKGWGMWPTYLSLAFSVSMLLAAASLVVYEFLSHNTYS